MTADQKKEQFITAYTELTDKIFKYFLFRVYNRDDAKELAQETFIKVWKYIVDGKEIQNINAFVYKVAYHLVVDNSKKKKEQSLDLLFENGFNVEEEKSLSTEDKRDCLSAFQEIEKMDETYKEILILRYVDDLPVNEIAQTLGLSENLVSVRIHRGLNQLRTNIEK
ncbi:MAG: RNA polymerase sigma factor [Patescibacteria group bacterium]